MNSKPAQRRDQGTQRQYITIAEAAAILGVSTTTLRRLIEAGVLTRGTIRGGRGVRLRRAEVEDLIKWEKAC